MPVGERSLLEVLREELGVRSVKDGCSPQGQCGCCTVLVDGAPRVACVTSVRRVDGRAVSTVDGLPEDIAGPLVDALVAAGGSQCGFCTPGIVCRLAALGPEPTPEAVDTALLAHLCRCTGWQGIKEAARSWRPGAPAAAGTDPAADRRAALEGHHPQRVGREAAIGRGGFADDTAPAGALVAVPAEGGGMAEGATVGKARAAAGHRQGRRSGRPLTWPVEVPEGDWDVVLQTTWVEPAYLEPDASWCEPGGLPASPVANGGAFGGKAAGLVAATARTLAERHGHPVRVVWSREDVVRHGPKRPPIAAGVRLDGTGVLRVVRTPDLAAAVRSAAADWDVQEIDVAGPPTSAAPRGAGWAEAAVLLAALDARRAGTAPEAGPAAATATIGSPGGGRAVATVEVDAAGLPTGVEVEVAAGDPLDPTVLCSYATGAAHMALGWVCSEGIAVDEDGRPEDLTIRSFGVLRARDTPPIIVRVADAGGPAVNGSDAVFAAVAAATWIAQGLPPRWPSRRGAWR